MGQLHSFANETRQIYSQTRRQIDLMVRAGKIAPQCAEEAFRQRASEQLTKIGRPVPKTWKVSVKESTGSSNGSSASNATSTQSVSGAVKAGVIVSGALSVTQNLHQVFTGEKEMHLAAKDVAIDVVTAGISSATIAGTAEGIKFVAKSWLPNATKSFVKGSAPVVIASGAIELAVDACKGTLTTKTASVTVARTAGGWAGAEVGAATGVAIGSVLAPFTAGISIPVLAFVGGLAGGIGGSVGAAKLVEYAIF